MAKGHAEESTMPQNTFRYDLASLREPRVILITNLNGKRSDVPRLGYVVLPRGPGKTVRS